MKSMVLDPDAAAAVATLESGLAAIQDLDFAALGDGDLRSLIEVAETAGRRLASAQIGLLDAADRRDLGRADGFFSAKNLVRHVGRLSPGRAAARDKAMRALRQLPDVETALARGEIGVEQVELLGKVHANTRVCDQMAERQTTFLAQAERSSFADFTLDVRRWEQLADEDGTEPTNSRNHHNRDVNLVQDPVDRGWHLTGGYGALQGSALEEILGFYIDAETAADWEKARAEHGDDARYSDLPRSQAQRRADAMWQIFQDGANNETTAVPIGYTHHIVWNADTYQYGCDRIEGRAGPVLDPDTMRCQTLDGVPLDPIETAVESLFGAIRRVVVDAEGVVIDLGAARFFTGSARTAVKLSSTHCIWPGCDRPASRCQADHVVPHAKGGRTNPRNGANLCEGHNRLKEHGYTVWRDPAGQWHITKPDGTRLE
ncbi:MAG: DUF222 domain-containing protein [Acidimicrobiales bacterium]